MTWKSKIMPDDAPELAGSLVGSMLQGQADASEEPAAELQDFQIEAGFKDKPLWLVMAAALAAAEGSHARLAQQFGRGTPRDMAAVMDAVRIAMLPDEEPPDSHKDTPELRWKSTLWCAYNQRQALRDFLRCEADVARGLTQRLEMQR